MVRYIVDFYFVVGDYRFDYVFFFEVGDVLVGEWVVDFYMVDEGSDGDEVVGLDIFVEFFRGGFVE